MKFLGFSLLAGLAVAAPSLQALEKRQNPGRGQVTISKVEYSGNGCPQGSATAIISDDATIVTLGFDKFAAEIGPRAQQDKKQRNCQIHLNLRYPNGYTFSVMNA